MVLPGTLTDTQRWVSDRICASNQLFSISKPQTQVVAYFVLVTQTGVSK